MVWTHRLWLVLLCNARRVISQSASQISYYFVTDPGLGYNVSKKIKINNLTRLSSPIRNLGQLVDEFRQS